MPLIVRVYCEKRIYSMDLSENNRVTIGNDPADILRFVHCGLKKNQIIIENAHGSYMIKGKHLYNRENSPVSSVKIKAGDIYYIDSNPEIYIAIHPKQGDSNKAIGLHNVQEIYIGRSRSNNIILHNRRTSSKHCKIFRESGVLKICDLRSSNGTFVNGEKIQEKTLVDGDKINISIYEIVLKNNALTFYNVGDDLELNLATEKKKEERGTISVFDLNTDITNSSDEIKQKIETGTKSVF